MPQDANDARPAEMVAGIGASAGGLDALERLFTRLSPDLPIAYVVAQHLSPDHKSMMVDLLSKRTTLAVAAAYDHAPLRCGQVYLVPPHANVRVEGAHLRLSSRAAPHALNLPIDELLCSLAASFGERAIGIVLSGTGSDGRDGIVAIKGAGGLAMAQDPTTASFDGMPREAIRTGLVDIVLGPDGLAAELERLGRDHHLLGALDGPTAPDDAFQRVVAGVKQAIGFDLSAYKLTTLMRRLERRMAAIGVDTLDALADRVEGDPDEARNLLADVLINVTEFFRDEPVFDALETTHLAELCGRVAGEPLRVWVPGCASGEEAYSIAMLLSERRCDFKLFGTDVDEDALASATSGVYSEEALAPISPERRERFFTRRDHQFEVDRELRKRVVFAQHDLLADPPFTRMHLVSCRNLLIYLTPEAQARALDALSFALRPGGLLVLGTSEVLGGRFDDFKAVDAHLKIFARREGRRPIPIPHTRVRLEHAAPAPSDDDQAAQAALRILTDRVSEAAVLVGEHLRVLRVFGNASRLLTLAVGEPSLELTALLPDGLRAVTHVATHRAMTIGAEVVLSTAQPDSPVALVRAMPFSLRPSGARFALVVFEPPTHTKEKASPEDSAHIAALQRELTQARQSLQAAVEELETSNEELQATNEELLASNEELQATNEELQSVNEELHTVNVEHQARIIELSETNADLDNLLNASPIATIFLDEKLRVRRFNPPVATIFPLVDADRGRPLAHFTGVVETGPLLADLAAVLESAQRFEREITTTAGRRFWVRAVPHIGPQRRVCGAVLTFADITSLHESKASQDLLQGVIDALAAHVAVLDDDGVIRFVNAAWLDFAQHNGGRGVSVGASYLDACRDAPEVATAIRAVLDGHRSFFSCEYPCHSPTERRWYLMHVQRTRDERRTVVTHTDVTATKRSTP